MSRIRVIVEDESGFVVERSYPLRGDLNTLDGIDEAVEQFKNQALPVIEQTLLDQSEKREVAAAKKKAVASKRPS